MEEENYYHELLRNNTTLLKTTMGSKWRMLRYWREIGHSFIKKLYKVVPSMQYNFLYLDFDGQWVALLQAYQKTRLAMRT